MGIKNLHKFLKKHAKSIYNEISLEKYRNKSIAIDINIYLYRYKNIYRQNWLNGIFNLLMTLREYNINIVCIYDSKAPIEKNEKKKERKEKKRNAEKKIAEIKHDLELYHETLQISELLQEIIKKHHKKGKSRLLLINESLNILMNEEYIEDELYQLQKQIINITYEDILLSKELLDLLQIPWYDSKTEAETMCSYMACYKLIDAVLTHDTDVLVYGTPYFLSSLNIKTRTCIEIQYESILKELNITNEQFVDFCIMCGTDYNKNIHRIGNEKAYNLIKDYKSLDEITHLDLTILNYRRVRDIFKVPEMTLDYVGLKIENGKPDINILREFMNTYNLSVKSLRIENN